MPTDLQDGEILKDYPGYDGRYAITNYGRVWSYPKPIVMPNGGVRKHSGKWLKYYSNIDNYSIVCLCLNKKSKNHRISRMVAELFCENDDPEHKTQVNHKHESGDKSNDHYLNLEWCTQSHNILHRNNVLGYKHSNETKKKIANSHLGKKYNVKSTRTWL